MPCSEVSINKNYKCDKVTCICIPTDGKPCICVCVNENGDIIRCDDCKCSTGSCQCKCDDAKCICIVTKGAACICVCRDEGGNFKTCDCSCTELNEKDRASKPSKCCSRKLEKETCGYNCNSKKNLQTSLRAATVRNIYKCNQVGCVCIPTEGKPCVCICENESGDIIRCDDCKCSTGSCQCKCDDAKCTCIVTKGAACICVCRDEGGNFKTCDCSCTELNEKERASKPSKCCSSKLEKGACGHNCNNNGKINLQTSRQAATIRGITRCDDCMCANSGTCQCNCDDVKYACIVTKGAACVCVRRDGRGNINNCDCSCTALDKERPCCRKVSEKCFKEQAKSYSCCRRQEKESFEGNCKCVNNTFIDGCLYGHNWKNTRGNNTCTRNNLKVIEASKKYPFAPVINSSNCICGNEGELVCCNDCKCNDSKHCDNNGCICYERVSEMKTLYQKCTGADYLCHGRGTRSCYEDNVGVLKKACCMAAQKKCSNDCMCCNCKNSNSVCFNNEETLSCSCCNITGKTLSFNFANGTYKNCTCNFCKDCYCVSETKKGFLDDCADCVCDTYRGSDDCICVVKKTTRSCTCCHQDNVKCCGTCITLKSREVARTAKRCDSMNSHLSKEVSCACGTCKKSTCSSNDKRTNVKCWKACIFESENACTCIPIFVESGVCVCADNDGKLMRRDYSRNCKKTCACVCSKGNCVCKNANDVSSCGNCN